MYSLATDAGPPAQETSSPESLARAVHVRAIEKNAVAEHGSTTEAKVVVEMTAGG